MSTCLSTTCLSKQVQKISSISDFLVAKKNGQAVLDSLSDEKIEIVSLTITEKGYCYNSEKRELDFTNQEIVEDLSNIKNPQTAIGFIVAGLRKRYLNSKKPFTILKEYSVEYCFEKIKSTASGEGVKISRVQIS